MDTQQLLNVFNFIPKVRPYIVLIVCFITVAIYFLYSWHSKKSFLAKRFLTAGTVTLGSSLLLLAIISSILQGLIWTSDPHSVTKALAPPFTPFNYIFSYVWMHFLKGTVFTLVGAIALFFLLKFINKIGHDRFFYEEEYWLAALGCLAVGWPNLILYFFIAAFLNIFAHIIAIIVKKRKE